MTITLSRDLYLVIILSGLHIKPLAQYRQLSGSIWFVTQFKSQSNLAGTLKV